MKLFLSLLFSTFILFQGSHLAAQTEAFPPKTINSLKAGLVGIWYSHERMIAPQTTLNIEAGFDAAFNSRAFSESSGLQFGLVPTLKLEPRFYYNLFKRQEYGKITKDYSANFLALSIHGNPNLVIPDPTPGVTPSLRIIPKWGLRRAFGSRFFFEGAIGYGISATKLNVNGAPGLDLRVGYIF